MAGKTDAKELIKALTEVEQRLEEVSVYISNARDFCRPRSGKSVLDTLILCNGQNSKGGRALVALLNAIKRSEKLMLGLDKKSPMYKLASALVDRAKRSHRESQGQVQTHIRELDTWYKRLAKIKHP